MRALRDGHLVALPTETVYGLAGRADSAPPSPGSTEPRAAPRRIRCIVHLPTRPNWPQWSRAMPEWVAGLTQRCWPGPLTVIVPRADHVGDYLTGGQDTVGVRVPGHPIAHEPATTPRCVRSQPRRPTASVTSARPPPACPRRAGAIPRPGGRPDPRRWSVPRRRRVDHRGRQRRAAPADATRPHLGGQIEEVTGPPVVPNPTPRRSRAGQLEAHYAPSAGTGGSTRSPDGRRAMTCSATQRTVWSVHRAGSTPPFDSLDPTCAVCCDCRTDTELAHDLYDALRAADDLGMSAVVAVARHPVTEWPPPCATG